MTNGLVLLDHYWSMCPKWWSPFRQLFDLMMAITTHDASPLAHFIKVEPSLFTVNVPLARMYILVEHVVHVWIGLQIQVLTPVKQICLAKLMKFEIHRSRWLGKSNTLKRKHSWTWIHGSAVRLALTIMQDLIATYLKGRCILQDTIHIQLDRQNVGRAGEIPRWAKKLM